MRLSRFVIKNFRGFENQKIEISNFTTLVGINDSGKSTILEAMDIFFGNSKIEKDDRNKNNIGEPVELIAYFDELPKSIILETIPSGFEEQFLLKEEQSKKYLVIKQVFSGESLKKSEYLICDFPADDSIKGILTKKITALKKEYGDLLDDIDKRKSGEIRKAALNEAYKKANGNLVETDIELNGKESVKDISSAIHSNLPLFQLFKADRNNTDSDSEIQDPVKAIINTVIAENSSIRQNLQEVTDIIKNAVEQTTRQTLTMLQEMDSNLANDMIPEFPEPKWGSLFKFSLETDSGIPLNKRGSGIRRLILLNFFRAEAQRRLDDASNAHEINIIYAFEEPETAQHPKYQKMLIDSFKTMSETEHVQVMITTHSPAIANVTPIDGIKLVQKYNGGSRIQTGKSAINKVIDELGIVPNIKIYPDQIKRTVFVEGPTDVSFFENMYLQRSVNPDKNNTFFVSGGGTTIIDFIDSKFVNKLNLEKKIMIVDGDDAGSKDKDNLHSESNTQVIQLKKSTVEFYLPYDKVKEILDRYHQNPLTTSQEQWETGDNQFKLNPKQKNKLKTHDIYRNLKFEELTEEVQEEILKIIEKIDS